MHLLAAQIREGRLFITDAQTGTDKLGPIGVGLTRPDGERASILEGATIAGPADKPTVIWPALDGLVLTLQFWIANGTSNLMLFLRATHATGSEAVRIDEFRLEAPAGFSDAPIARLTDYREGLLHLVDATGARLGVGYLQSELTYTAMSHGPPGEGLTLATRRVSALGPWAIAPGTLCEPLTAFLAFDMDPPTASKERTLAEYYLNS